MAAYPSAARRRSRVPRRVASQAPPEEAEGLYPDPARPAEPQQVAVVAVVVVAATVAGAVVAAPAPARPR